MRRFLLAVILIASPAFAIDNGQYNNVDPKVRQWFDSVKVPNSNRSCCSIADGHRTDWEIRPDGFYVPVPWQPKGREYWVLVPPEAIVRNAGNPTGDAVIWYMPTNLIRCFVPGDGV